MRATKRRQIYDSRFFFFTYFISYNVRVTLVLKVGILNRHHLNRELMTGNEETPSHHSEILVSEWFLPTYSGYLNAYFVCDAVSGFPMARSCTLWESQIWLMYEVPTAASPDKRNLLASLWRSAVSQ